jgi:molybdenum cofactor synthesis domain-containing protein
MNIAVVCVSDRSFVGEREDKSGPLIQHMVAHLDPAASYTCVPDGKEQIRALLVHLCDIAGGYCAHNGRNRPCAAGCDPEATLAVIEKTVPGISEAMRAASLKITDRAMLSRAVAGIRGSTLIINLPGSPKAVRENLETVMPILEHASALLHGNITDCGVVPSEESLKL